MTQATAPAIDLDAYFDRLHYAGPRRPTKAVLDDLHLAHATHIPFENLDVLLGRPIRLDLPSLQGKLVQGKRGGYCFEQNVLFAAVLEQLGFAVTRLAARVRLGTQSLLPRTHMLLAVEADGGRWLADVGFGGAGLLHPIPLVSGQMARQFAWTYRVVEDSGLWVLQAAHREAWQDLYAFTLEPHYLVDYEMASHYVSTHPDSIFVRTLTAQLPTPEVRYALRNLELTTDRGNETQTRKLTQDELPGVLATTFGLELPPGIRLPPPPPTAG
jgi:N-hydroxyarylamine O-acetyltransferase